MTVSGGKLLKPGIEDLIAARAEIERLRAALVMLSNEFSKNGDAVKPLFVIDTCSRALKGGDDG